jgi:putative transposase
MAKTYFVTASAYMHQNLFQRHESAQLLLNTISRYRDAGEFLLHEFVVMPNHIHLLLSVDDDHAIGRAMQMVKGGFSHALREAGLKSIAVWQPNYYEHRVRDIDEYGRMRSYIHDNPVRRGLAETALAYPYSSAATSVSLDEVPDRLKPRNNSGNLDAGLKARTTRSVRQETAAPKIGITHV